MKENYFFTWNAIKYIKNLEKHKVSFEEAITVFCDPLAVSIPDKDGSIGEERFLIIGKTTFDKTLVVCYCNHVGGEIRIISARLATRKERKTYEGGYYER